MQVRRTGNASQLRMHDVSEIIDQGRTFCQLVMLCILRPRLSFISCVSWGQVIERHSSSLLLVSLEARCLEILNIVIHFLYAIFILFILARASRHVCMKGRCLLFYMLSHYQQIKTRSRKARLVDGDQELGCPPRPGRPAILLLEEQTLLYFLISF